MYNKVVVAVDLSDETKKVVERALGLVESQADKLVLVHVVEPIPTVWGMETYTLDPIDLQQRIVDNAADVLAKLGESNGIKAGNLHTVLGPPAGEIRDLAEKQGADAIVIGSHGHAGWKRLLGSTAIKLLHGATCDVLTVYVGDKG